MAEPEDPQELTQLLRSNEAEASSRLLERVYDELRGMAERRMQQERAGHTLQATALVHEAYSRLLGGVQTDWRDRKHFFGAAAEAMRRVLVDHARRAGTLKRGGDLQRVTLGQASGELELGAERLLALDEALETLAREDARAAQVTQLRFFTGLSVEETAELLEISPRTVAREWEFAKSRLFELMSKDD